MKYHLTKDGPSVCTASKRACPLGGEHFDNSEAAHHAFETTMKKKAPIAYGLPKLEIQSWLSMKKNNSYVGSTIEESALNNHLKAWRKVIGEKHELLEQNKELRDGDVSFHITVLSPQETRRLKDKNLDLSKAYSFTTVGIGSIETEDKEAWFIVIESDEIQELRKDLGLTHKDLHITIGFNPKDIHNEPKDRTTLKIV